MCRRLACPGRGHQPVTVAAVTRDEHCHAGTNKHDHVGADNHNLTHPDNRCNVHGYEQPNRADGTYVQPDDHHNHTAGNDAEQRCSGQHADRPGHDDRPGDHHNTHELGRRRPG